MYEKDISKSFFDKIKFYNHKGIEIDDSDVSYLTDQQIIYISLDGSKFSTLNYVYEYETIKPIKSGGFAEVYLAKHVIDGTLVSIKKTDLSNFSTEDLYGISREAVYLSSLIHKNIIKMYSSYTYNNCLYNVMQYAEGGELSDGTEGRCDYRRRPCRSCCSGGAAQAGHPQHDHSGARGDAGRHPAPVHP